MHQCLPSTDAVAALDPDSPVLFSHLGSNEAARMDYSFGAPEHAFEVAHRVVTGVYRMNRHGAVPLECRGVLARFDGRRGRTEITTSTQVPHMVRNAICAVTGWAEAEIKVSVPDVGGGFGTKANVYGEEIMLAVLSRLTGYTLIWVEDRQEHLVASAQARDQLHHTRMAVDVDGRILAWEDDFVVDIGAGSLWVAGIVANTAIHLLGPYRIPAAHISGRAALTNKTLVAQYRGAGRPEATFALERTLDAAALELGISAAEIRRRNLLTADDMPYPRPIPYRDGVPISYDGGDYLACLESVLESLPADGGRTCAPQRTPTSGSDTGWRPTSRRPGRGPHETARVRLLPDGRIEATAGARRPARDTRRRSPRWPPRRWGCRMDRVSFVPSDTERLPDGRRHVREPVGRPRRFRSSPGRVAARSTLAAARAAVLLGVPPSDDPLQQGPVHAPAGDVLDWAELAAAQPGGRASRGRRRAGRHRRVPGGDGDVDDGRARGDPRGAPPHRNRQGPALRRDPRRGPRDQPQGRRGPGHRRRRPGHRRRAVRAVAVFRHRRADVDDLRGISPPAVDRRAAGDGQAHRTSTPRSNPIGVRGAGESGTIAVYSAVASAVDDAVGGGYHVGSTPIADR